MSAAEELQIGPRLTVRCRAQSGSIAELEVLDISAGGCMVEYVGWQADPGERVLTTVRGLGVEPSRLIWVEDGRAGIAFERPLHTAVYDYLAALLDGREADRSLAAAEAKEKAAKAPAPKRKVY